VQTSAGGAVATVTPGMAGYIYSTSNATATGGWAGYAFVPGSGPTGGVTWGTAGLNLGGGSLTAASLALGGATLGSNALAVTGSVKIGTDANSGLISASYAFWHEIFAYDNSGNDKVGLFGNIGGQNGVWVSNDSSFVFSNLAYTNGATAKTSLTSPAAATLQHGAADAAAPVAQTIGVQNVVAGTSNTNGADFTIRGSAGTGTGLGGSIIFQVAPAGTTGTAQNAFATALTIDSTKTVTFAGVSKTTPSATLPSSPAAGMIAAVNTATFPTIGSALTLGGSAYALAWYNNAQWTVIGN